MRDLILQLSKSSIYSTKPLAASGVAYKERLNMPVVAEVVAREQPEHLREYFMERVRYYREQSIQLPRVSDPRYLEMAEQNAKK
ncbi:TPA: DNA polymerase III subunit theta [Klebsiella pneumoniae]|uniref:DNA polymerase III subunit theta n=1 Tax=Klebsiella pneumoniae TaxID=573 RepID=UPI001FAA94A0|nr:DNA polymerase III subunit theta [Klebsiella pneumoniae]HCI5706700.1 DNA polymerase III subunit theta [Klebsiella pneumoniae]HDU8305350.1 DNA polymerase III subunit theta [Klebsiella pneumoniae]